VKVRRLGGAYGAKITRPPQLAAACAIAVKNLNRPVRLVLTMSENMEAFGMRYGLKNNYEVRYFFIVEFNYYSYFNE
jgi:xanthine dehydrogenase/oxidase